MDSASDKEAGCDAVGRLMDEGIARRGSNMPWYRNDSPSRSVSDAACFAVSIAPGCHGHGERPPLPHMREFKLRADARVRDASASRTCSDCSNGCVSTTWSRAAELLRHCSAARGIWREGKPGGPARVLCTTPPSLPASRRPGRFLQKTIARRSAPEQLRTLRLSKRSPFPYLCVGAQLCWMYAGLQALRAPCGSPRAAALGNARPI